MMNNEQDKYNDYDTEELYSDGVSRSRRRRAAKLRQANAEEAKSSTRNDNSFSSNDNGTEYDYSKILVESGLIDIINTDDTESNDKYNDTNDSSVQNDSDTDDSVQFVDPVIADGGDDKKGKKKRSPLKTFLFILLSIVGIYIIVVGVFAISTYFNDDPTDDWSIQNNEKPISKITEVFSAKLPEKTQFVIMCTDEDGTRTDTIIVGCYNSVTQGISLLSVPRDTIVSVSAADFQTMREEFPEPGKRTMKINAIHHYSGDEKGPEMLVKYLNEMLGTDIQYYVRVNFDAFHYLIDSIGGIEFDVPQNMDYDDPTQDLAIHLKAGLQTLDGDKAEQLVRYRKDNYGGGYINGDLGRIEMQQNFMKVLIQKLVSVDTIKSNPKAYATAFFKYVKTNAGVTDAIKYASALNKIDASKMETYTLPGDIDYVEGISGYSADMDAVKELCYNIFERSTEDILAEEQSNATADTQETVQDSKSAKIQVLNGGYTNGKASEVQAELQDEGYNVENIGTYNDEKQAETRIYVNKDGLGKDLKQYFKNAEVIIDTTSTKDYDIVVVIGTDE
jgi:LCP family protein required for cell wall assembly